MKIKRVPQLLKWVGNKHRYAEIIVGAMPNKVGNYIEPFVGTGAVLGAVVNSLEIDGAIAGDTLTPLIELWKLVKESPELVSKSYSENWHKYMINKKDAYNEVKNNYNKNPNGLDLLFISRTCYGGVMRFTKQNTISTPIGPHRPISPEKFAKRLALWHSVAEKTTFYDQDFSKTMDLAKEGDLVYCDPPYIYTQSILYGSQDFDVNELFRSISKCKERGVKVMLSLDGKKKSSKDKLKIDFPEGLFSRELLIDCGISMLRRFQKKGEKMIGEDVHDRLLLTW